MNDKYIMANDGMILLEASRLLGLDVSGSETGDIIGAIKRLKARVAEQSAKDKIHALRTLRNEAKKIIEKYGWDQNEYLDLAAALYIADHELLPSTDLTGETG
jgi:hypothetical protein